MSAQLYFGLCLQHGGALAKLTLTSLFDWFSGIIPSFLCGFRGWAMDATPGHSSSHCCPVGEYSKVSVR